MVKVLSDRGGQLASYQVCDVDFFLTDHSGDQIVENSVFILGAIDSVGKLAKVAVNMPFAHPRIGRS